MQGDFVQLKERILNLGCAVNLKYRQVVKEGIRNDSAVQSKHHDGNTPDKEVFCP
jgi:hypothetical protein